jgi:hypothetical protein
MTISSFISKLLFVSGWTVDGAVGSLIGSLSAVHIDLRQRPYDAPMIRHPPRPLPPFGTQAQACQSDGLPVCSASIVRDAGAAAVPTGRAGDPAPIKRWQCSKKTGYAARQVGANRADDSRADMAKSDQPITIKRYANRRLYNPGAGGYVTLEELGAMVEDEEDFVVYDAATGDDLTHSVLKQIIVERARHG